MNIFAMTSFLAIVCGAQIAFNFAIHFGFWLAVLAAVAGAVCGYFIGPILGLLFLLPFEGVARLWRYSRTGNWKDQKLTTISNDSKPDDHAA